MPWPLRWALLAIVLGFCAAIALWAFELGKSIAGIDGASRAELSQLRLELAQLREERERAQSVVNTSGSLLTAEHAVQERLQAQVHQLEQDNQALRDDLGFFERLIPSNGADGLSIRGLQAEVLGGQQVRWQVLVIQPAKSVSEFSGQLELVLSGTLAGKPWDMPLPGGPAKLQFRQYRRLEGMVELPAQAVVKVITARVLDGAAGVRAVQTLKL
jgi:hypothetical protein